MKVYELIKILSAQEQDLDVVVSTYSCGEVFRNPLRVTDLSINLIEETLTIDAEDN